MKDLFYKEVSVRRKPWFMKLLMGKDMAALFMGKIYLRDDYDAKFMANTVNIDPETASYLEHELRHLERERENLSRLIFYWLSPTVRTEEEMAAIRKEMEVRKAYGLGFDFNNRAKSLSGCPYPWTLHYKDALKKLTDLWKEA